MFIIAVDVGGPEKIGWAASNGRTGSGADLDMVLRDAALRLTSGEPVALGFEAPIWTPRRDALSGITSRRGGAEIIFNRAWSTSAGACVLAAGLGLMPWCFSQIAGQTSERHATTLPSRFATAGRGLFVWEAFVSGPAKASAHDDDAALALTAFEARSLDHQSDIPDEPAINLAAAALLATGWSVDASEIGSAGHVVAAGLPAALAARNARHRL